MTEAPQRRRKLAAILMADVSGFSAMMGRDEERTTELIQAFHKRVEKTVHEHQGRVVDTAGDSVFGEFDSVVNAVRCAESIQSEQRSVNRDAADEERILTRIGVHLGDVIVEGARVYGDGVNIAARLEQLAEPGGVLVSEAVYQQIHNKLELSFADEGPRALKNIEHPVRTYSLRGAPARIETRPGLPATRSPEPVEQAGPVKPVATARSAPHAVPGNIARRWLHEIVRAGVLVPVLTGVGLLLSERFILPSGGVLPTGGAILLATMLGLVWKRLSGQPGNQQIALGLGIASGALFTAWSPATNALFVFGGLATAATGLSRNFAPQPEPRERPARRRRRRRARGDERPSGRPRLDR